MNLPPFRPKIDGLHVAIIADIYTGQLGVIDPHDKAIYYAPGCRHARSSRIEEVRCECQCLPRMTYRNVEEIQACSIPIGRFSSS